MLTFQRFIFLNLVFFNSLFFENNKIRNIFLNTFTKTFNSIKNMNYLLSLQSL